MADDPSISTLFSDVIGQVTNLFRTEIRWPKPSSAKAHAVPSGRGFRHRWHGPPGRGALSVPPVAGPVAGGARRP